MQMFLKGGTFFRAMVLHRAVGTTAGKEQGELLSGSLQTAARGILGAPHARGASPPITDPEMNSPHNGFYEKVRKARSAA
jgi:hypothetical protein